MALKPLKECKILVTPTSFSKYDMSLSESLENAVGKVLYNTTGKPLTEKDLLPIIADYDGYIAGLDDITAKVIRNAINLKVISRYGTGVDRVDLEAAMEAGIYVTNTPGANSVSVAELTIGLAIVAARSVIEGNNRTKEGSWPRLSGTALSGKTFGIIGLGNVGKEVTKRLNAFGAKIIFYDIKYDEEFVMANKLTYCDLEGLLKDSDFVSLHIPVTKETKNLINKDNLSLMKKNAILINTARGELIDEDALFKSLSNKNLKAAALDAFIKEPPEPGNKLISLPQVITTPHLGGATDYASNEMTKVSIEECLSVLKGLKPRYSVL